MWELQYVLPGGVETQYRYRIVPVKARGNRHINLCKYAHQHVFWRLEEGQSGERGQLWRTYEFLHTTNGGSKIASFIFNFPLPPACFLLPPLTSITLQLHQLETMSPVSVVLVGCGAPLRSMGWYHATQILHEGSNM